MGVGATILAATDDNGHSTFKSNTIYKNSSYDNEPPSRFGTKPKYDDFIPGDILKVRMGRGRMSEGLMVERMDHSHVLVDFGGIELQQCHIEDCMLVVKADELEVGDKVEMKPQNMNLYFVGKILRIVESGRNVDESLTKSAGNITNKQSIITKISTSGSGKQHDRATAVITRKTTMLTGGAHAMPSSSVTAEVSSTSTIMLDILMEGDDEDDIEYNVPFESVRKLMSRRA